MIEIDWETERLMKAPEAAKTLGMGTSTLWAKLKKGLVPKPYKFGNSTLWKYSELLQFIQTLPQRGATP